MNFYRAFIASPSHQPWRAVAVGIAPLQNKDGVAFYWAGGEGRRIVGKILKDDDSGIIVEDARASNSNGTQAVWTFAPLTMEGLKAMKKDISGFDALMEMIASDEDAEDFYSETFLPQYWIEFYEQGERYGSE